MSIYKMGKIVLALLLAGCLGGTYVPASLDGTGITGAAWAKSYTYTFDETSGAWSLTSDESGSGLTVVYPDYTGAVESAIVEKEYTYTDADGNTQTIKYKTVDTDAIKSAQKSITIETNFGTGSSQSTTNVTLGSSSGEQITFTYNYDSNDLHTESINNSGTYADSDGSTTITGVFRGISGSESHAIYNSGTGSTIDTITAAFINDSDTTSSSNAGGGAIYNGNGSTINLITGSYFIGDSSANNSDNIYGGAIYNESATINKIEKSYFIGDSAESSGTGNKYSYGGAISNYSSDGENSTIGTIESCVFLGNSSTYGAAIANYSEKNSTGTSKIDSIKGCYFVGNFSTESSNLNNYNVIYNYGSGSSIGSIENCVFFANSVCSIQNASSGTIGSITGNIFAGNSAYSISGVTTDSFANNIFIANSSSAMYSCTISCIDSCVFVGNSSSSYGGAIMNVEACTIVEIKDSIFAKNSNTSSNQGGGAIFNCEGGTIGNFTNSYFVGNKADSDSGGAIYNNSNATMGNIEGSYFVENTAASGSGGAIYNNSSVTMGYIKDSYFVENTATDGAGGAIYNNKNVTTGDITDSYFLGNKSTGTSTGQGRGGAIFNDGTVTMGSISGSYFIDNTASLYGGAIYNNQNATIASIKNSYFEGNIAQAGNGGAIENGWGTSVIGDITGSTFIGNEAHKNGDNDSTGYGAAIYNEGIIGSVDDERNIKDDGTGISSCVFIENVAEERGGAIYNRYNSNENTTSIISAISKSYFEANEAGRGGAIYNDVDSMIGSITDCTFIGNIANLYGGAIYNNEGSDIGSISGSYFKDNVAKAGNGGAIENAWHESTIGDITNNYFEGNKAIKSGEDETTGHGAAIYNEGKIGYGTDDSVTGGISKSTFKNNTADGDGGAIYNATGVDSANSNATTYSKISSIDDCYFDGNVATSGSGGAIYNAAGCTLGTITNSSFVNNSAGEKGGAIYTTSDLTIAADGASVVFQNNKATSGGDAIYMAKDKDGKETTLSFSLSDGGSIALYDSVSGEGDYSVNISGDGTFYLYNDLEGAALTIGSEISPLSATDSGTLLLSTVNDEIHKYEVKSFTLADDFNMVADVDLASETMDRFVTTADSDKYTVASGSTLTISDLNLISDANSDRAAVYFAEEGLMANVTSSVGTAYAPVHEYKIDYVYLDNDTITDANGETYSASESELLSSSASGGYFIFENIGYNSAAMASSFAAMSTFSAMGMMIDYNFEHSDYFMKLPEEVRLAKAEAAKAQKSASKIKENDPRRLAYYNQNEMTERGAWFKSFYANESVSYRGGWDSRDKYYGGLVGFDTDMHVNENGWASVLTGYVGTIGIRQEYSGGHIKQHGGLVGVTGSFYKKNFYTAWTAAAGFTKAHEHTMYGHDTSKNDTWGIAGKFGWNFELAGGKYSLLPTFTASYTTVNPEDYTNAADVKFTGSGVRAVQLNPNVKFIMNAENGLQPYLTVGEVWTVGQSSGIKANGEKLPELEMKSYTEYGLGVQKRWANERDAYVQFLGHSHGRDGFVLNAGVRWSF